MCSFYNVVDDALVHDHSNESCLAVLTCAAGRLGGIMVSVLDSRSNGLGSSPGQGNCVVFLGKTLYSHSFFSTHFPLIVPLSTQVF